MSSEADAEITIDGRSWRYWSNLKVTRFADSIATVELTATFDPDNAEFRETFRPFAYRRLTVTVGGDLIFIGTIMSVAPSVTADAQTVAVTAYALCGVANDCAPPPANFPLQYKGLKIGVISRRLLEPLGIDLLVDLDTEGSVFEEVALTPGQAILPFLAGLAAQRGVIFTSDFDGALVLKKPAAPGTPPVARLEDGKQPVTRVSPTFEVQAFYSEITGISKAKGGRAGSRFTVANPLFRGDAFRPWTMELSDTEPADVPAATEAAISQMYASTVSYSVDLATIRDQDDQLFAPDVYVSLDAPGAMIYGPSLFYVRSSTLNVTPSACSSSLNLVLPGALSGTLPEVLPWEE